MIRTIIGHGYLGVELTYIINSFLYAKSYDNKVRNKKTNTWGLIGGMFARIIPLYYIAMTLNWLVSSSAGAEYGIGDIISHYLMINTVHYKWFNSFFGGSGYIGVLVLMWFLYPLYLRCGDTLEKVFIFAFVIIAIIYYVHVQVTYYWSIGNKELWMPEFQYIIRGISSFVAGNILYSLLSRKKYIISIRVAWIVTLCVICFLYSTLKCGKMNLLIFLFCVFVIIYVNYDNAIFLVDNVFLAIVGKYVYEIFIVHILLHYLLGYTILTNNQRLNLNIVLTFPVAIGAKKLIEEPLIKLIEAMKNRFQICAYRRKRKECS